MSRTGLHRPRRTRAVLRRPAPGTRLLPTPHSRLDHSLGLGIPLALSRVEGSQERNGWGLLPGPPQHTTHYKRCPKALRLRLRSDQSPSRPLYGRSPDKSRHPLSKGLCQVRAPLIRRIRFASSGDALEHGVMSPPWAIAPPPDSPGLDLAGQSEQSDERRLKTNAPFSDSAVAALAGQSGQSDERRLKTNAPFTDSTVVTIGEISGLRTPVSGPRSHPLGWSSTSGGRDCPTARLPRVSSTSPQKFGAVAEPSPMWNIRWSGHHPSVQA